VRNRSIRGATRTQIRKALPLIEENQVEEAQTAVREAVSALDKAAVKGVIHPNNAARRKSRLMLKLNSATAAAAVAQAEPAAKPARKSAKKTASPAAPAKAATRKSPTKKAPAKTSAKAPSKTKTK
jgi:small subunit ribosomal protein S20